MAFSLSSWFKNKPSSEPDGDPAPNGASAKEASPTAVAAPAPVAAPASVRTVMPKSAQPVSLRDPGTRQPVSLTSAVPPPSATNGSPAVRPLPGRKITFPVPSTPRPTAAVAVAAAPAPVAVTMPAIAAPAPAPEAPDVTVLLEVGDFVDRLPPNFLNPAPFDRHHKIEFRASEVYSDLTKGRASVPASTIYAKYPALFAKPVTDTEDIEVALPLQKIVEQLSAAFQTRADQVAEENVGEIETPFLQVAKEDGERLPTASGTVAGAIRPAISLPAFPSPAASSPEETANVLPTRPAHRTGQISTISAPKVPLDLPAPPAPAVGTSATGPINPGKRPPSTVRASVAGGKIRLSGPSAVTRMSVAPVQPIPPGAGAVPPPGSEPNGPTTASQRIQLPTQGAAPAANPSLAVSKKTARIQIPPISLRAGGTSATPRPGQVPPPAVPVQPSPVSIRPTAGADIPVTFRSSPPPPPSAKPPPASFAPAPRPSFPPPAFPAMPPAPAASAPAVPASAPATPPPGDDRKIELGLAAVLRGIPSEALTVEPWTLPDDLRVSLPFAGIEKQLSLGKVTIGIDVFQKALPESHRHVLAENSGLTEVQLPLPEIFQNLPSSALAIRSDQVTEEIGTYYPTPFSQKADEDAQRLGGPTAAVSSAAPEPVAESKPVVEEPAPAAVEAATPAFIDQPLSSMDAPPPVAEPEAPANVPAHDIPLDPVEPAAPAASHDEPPAAKPEATSEEPEVTVSPVANDLPMTPVIEPPAPVEPSPLEEALAVLESTAPAAAPVEAPAAQLTVPVPAPEPAAAPSSAATVKGRDSELQTLFMTEEEIDAKAVVRLVCQLPGVSGCAVMFADGLRLAGNFPEGDAEGFSAMAPPFYKRTQGFVSELKLGGLKAFTVYTEKDLLSFFMHNDICVSVRHSGRGFLPGVREKLEIVTREVAGMYSTVKAAPIDYPL